MRLPLFKVRIPDLDQALGVDASIVVYEVGPLAEVGARHPFALEIKRLGDVDVSIVSASVPAAEADRRFDKLLKCSADGCRHLFKGLCQARLLPEFATGTAGCPSFSTVEYEPPAALLRCESDGCCRVAKTRQGKYACGFGFVRQTEESGEACPEFAIRAEADDRRSSPPAALLKCSADGCRHLKEDLWVCLRQRAPLVQHAGLDCGSFEEAETQRSDKPVASELDEGLSP